MISPFVSSTEKILLNIFTGKKEITAKNWTIWHIGAGIGLLGGTLLLACAVFLTIFQFLYSEKPKGGWLFFVILPLWVLGAHCCDKIEETGRTRRIEYGKSAQ
jgi:hypothetical protein